ncbi:hypothetical protein [Domibacillus iocasae]|uniref:Multidrug ABC transporter permease n=1 Tax=Domibacillus iocasae TaxID=1714016 RepID=A0A1E7DPJ1_9BACI|nr:hypothetical protein [Domibacillus iocasae]OES45007.1 hypothetical protein BA724_07010 [Domibacillus iocasae]
MKSGILSFNKGLFLQHTRSVLWISVFFLLSQIVLLPLGMLVVLRDEWGVKAILDEKPENILLTISFAVQYITYMVFPVLAGIILTSYMTKKGSSDFVHSLPFKRSTLLTHVYAAGAISLAVPVLINTVILLVMRPFVHPITYTIGNIVEWAGLSMFIVLFMFIATVLIGLFIGPAILQGVMAYGIFVLPAALIVITVTNARYFIKGLAVEAYTAKIMEDGIFLVRAGSYETRPFGGTEWAVYIAVAAVTVAVSYYVYKVRPAEAGDETIVFPFFRWTFIFVLTFVAMMIGGMYFAVLLSGTIGWMIAGYVIGALAAYTLLQMIVQKSLRLIWPWKGFVFYTALVIVLIIPGTIFAKSYEQAIPDTNEIEKVYIGDSAEPFVNEFYMEEQKTLLKPNAGFMTGADSIEQVREVHTALMEEHNGSRLMDSYSVTIIYSLKDGSRMQRQYMVSPEVIADATGEIRKNPEFIKASSSLFALKNPNEITYLSIYNGATGSQMANVAEKATVDALRKALEQDMLMRESRMFSINYYASAGSLDLSIGKNRTQTNLYHDISLSDKQTIEAIREHVPNGELFASAEMVEEAYIVKAESPEEKQKLNDFIWSGEENPDLKEMPLEYEQVKSINEIRKLMNPDRLVEESERLLILKWKGNPGYTTITMVGLKE